MGALRAGGLTGLMNQPSSQVIDGSLRFDGSKSNKLTKTFGSSSNRTTWTWSGWVKKDANDKSDDQCLFGAYNANNDTDWFEFGFGGSNDHSPVDKFYWTTNSTTSGTTALLRDTSAWYHCLVTYNGTHISVYINNKLMLTSSKTGNLAVNANFSHSIGMGPKSSSPRPFFGSMSQVYLIDGVILGPGYFGFTDPLTGTWRPKKFRAEGTTVNDGTVWSGGIPGNVLSGYPATQGFDGNTSTFVYADNSSTMTWTAPKKIEGQLIEVYAYAGGSWPILKVNGKSTGAVVGGVTQHNVWVDVTDLCGGPGGNLETIQAFGQNISGTNRSSGWSAVRVDGVILTDSTTTNLAFGTNGFHLPFDGNSPIGQDKSGKGNDFTPANFGGSNSVDKATGALPILNTTPGGVSASVGVRTDAFANNLVVAMPLVGITTDVSNRINSGTTAKTVTQTGSSSDIAVSTEQSNFYGSSAKFQGNVSRLEISGGGGTDGDYDFGTGDFTMECWFYPTATVNTNNRLFCSRGDRTHYQLMIGSNKYLQFDIGGTSYTSANDVVALNKWQHFAATRQSGTLRLFVNGVIVKEQASVTTDLDETTGIDIGYESGYSSYINGYMQDARVYKGVAKYTSNFVPASTNPDVLLDTPSGVSGSSKLAKITDGAVAFDGTASSKLRVNDSTDFTFGTNDFCIEFFYYNKAFDGTYNILFDNVDTSRSGIQLAIETDNDYRIEVGDGAGNWIWQSTGFDAKVNKWTHFALTRQGSTFRAFEDGVLLGTQTSSTAVGDPRGPAIGGQAIDDSTNYGFNGFISNFRIVNGSSVYTANFTPPTRALTNITNTKLLCCQETKGGGGAAVSPTQSGFNTSESWSSTAIQNNPDDDRPIQHLFDGTTSNIIAAPSGNNATNRIDLGRSITATTSLRFYLNAGGYNNGKVTVFNGATEVGSVTAESSQSSGFYSLDAGSFPLTFTAIQVSRSSDGYGSGMSQIEVDSSILKDPLARFGDAAATNFNPFNTDINTVRGQETGYATLNPLRYSGYTTSDRIFTDGNLRMLGRGDGVSNFGATTGKFYAEVFVERIKSGESGQGYIGVIAEPGTYGERGWPTSKIAALRDSGGGGSNNFYGDGRGTTSTTWTEGDTISVAFDADAAKVWIAKNGSYINSGNPATGDTPSFSGLTFEDYYFLVSDNKPTSDSTTDGNRYQINFGQKPFKYAPPDGFQPLNAANIRPETVIARPDQYVGITTWKGDDADPRQIDLGMAPDLIWVKTRNQTNWHWLSDSLRGTADKRYKLYSNDTTVEDTAPIYGQADSFNDFGFVAGGGTNDAGEHLSDSNKSGTNYVCWSWKAGGSKGTFNVDDVGYASAAAAGLDGGSITPSGASVGTKQGFSILKYSGASGTKTISHGLLQAPTFVIVKCISGVSSQNWTIYHKDLPTGDYLKFTTDDKTDYPMFNDSTPNSSTIPLGNDDQVSGSSGTYILYAWHDVPGLQKFGVYKGNASTDGTFVELGFRPALLWRKGIDNDSRGWYILDNERNKHNPTNTFLDAADNDQDGTGTTVDFLSNGFKLRNSDAGTNHSETYIYCAWAEAPAINLYGGQSNAR